jgi:hypothetical protein
MPKAKNDHTPIQPSVPCIAKKPECTPYLDRPPAGWFALGVFPHQSELDWVANMISCHPIDIRGCLPGERQEPLQHLGWLPIPGKQRTPEAAWGALESMYDDQLGIRWWNGLTEPWRAFWMREVDDTTEIPAARQSGLWHAKGAWEEYKRQAARPWQSAQPAETH